MKSNRFTPWVNDHKNFVIHLLQGTNDSLEGVPALCDMASPPAIKPPENVSSSMVVAKKKKVSNREEGIKGYKYKYIG